MSENEAINLYEAKSQLSKLCLKAASGSDVVIARHGQPWVRITALDRPKRKIQFGVLKGKITLADDFDAQLPDDLLRSFEGV